MVTGVQRSGTTALFEALSRAHGVTPRDESPDDAIYDDYFLRPEPSVREAIRDLPGTILLKPVRETEQRTLARIGAEYAGHDLHLVWLYRDPANVFHSYLRRGWVAETHADAERWARGWLTRNISALDDAPELGSRLVIVRYEDLSLDPALVGRIAAAVGLGRPGRYGPDRGAGRSSLPPGILDLIDRTTGETLARLDGHRSFAANASRVRPSAAPSGLLGAVQRLLGRGRGSRPAATGGKSAAASSSVSPAAARRPVDPAVSALLHPSFRDIVTSIDDGETYRRRWSQGDATLREIEPGWFAALGFDAASDVLAGSRPSGGRPGSTGPGGDGLEGPSMQRLDAIRRHLHAAWVDPVELLGRTFDRQLERTLRRAHAADRTFRIRLVLESIVHDFDLALTRFEPDLLKRCCEAAQGLRPAGGGSTGRSAWTDLTEAMAGQGITGELVRHGFLERHEIPAFMADTVLELLMLPLIVCLALEVGERANLLSVPPGGSPAGIPGLLAESQRLMPGWASLRRICTRPIETGGVRVPAGAIVDILVCAAGRDPRRFPDPDAVRPDRAPPGCRFRESPWGGSLRLREDQPCGERRLLIDASAFVLERLVAERGPLRFTKVRDSDCLALPDGSALRVPFEGNLLTIGR